MRRLSTLTCPACGHRATEAMPAEACLFFHVCRGCGTRLRPKPGDCCVFCSCGDSCGDTPCPSVQALADDAAGHEAPVCCPGDE
ncbi:GDCCVxC domain-containing (seleno)protein [Chelatococcus sp. SYSU_G07232]|uniref:GDCCVxC domain-containing (Seleno)protein n=1 Tax=Chelatococcus albus TaxID=3047466 RepID=A0ABT7AJG7_9HYPH|nr:GDCCVxC domain-containing (seleno)protein [Chelatococcus sp. SYSU_G07232]MDJ1159516.1 GDCCVxC domain-containing (seleno)protein [Chelatococcus sp. SYSU_G07232]